MADENVNENQENETPADEAPPEAETTAQAAEEAVAEAPAAEAEEATTADAETPAEEVAAEAAEEAVAEAPAAEAEEPAEAGDEPAAAEAPAATEAPPAQQSGPKPKRKRLPRSERRQRTKPKRVAPAERKPIVRLEKPEQDRGRRQERQGTVVSDAMEKTIVVRVDVVKAHPRYKKVVRRSVKFHVHDETSQAKVGDVVRIVETRPLSKTKRWRLAEVVEAAK
jgi:small subunit ribosomal protein S17